MERRLLYSVLIIFFGWISYGQTPEAERGVLDLQSYNFYNSDLIPLDGEWEFYWEELINPERFKMGEDVPRPVYTNYLTEWKNVPDLQNSWHQFGYATYRLKIICGENNPPLSLYIPEVYSAYALYVNEDGFEGNGKVGENRLTSKPYWRPSSKVVELHPGMNEMVIQISNFDHHKGGPIRPVLLGKSDDVNYKRNFEIGSTLFLAGCLLIAGALALGLFWFNRTDYSGIFFCLFCFVYTYRVLGTGEYVIHAGLRFVPWGITLRMEYITLFLSVIFYTYFIRNLIEPKVKPIVFNIITGVSSLLTLMSLILPTYVFTAFIDYYLIFLGLMGVFVSIKYLLGINMSHKMSYVTLLGAVALSMVVLNKFQAHFKMGFENPVINTIGYVLFIFSQAIALAIRFGRNFRESFGAAQLAVRTKTDFLNTMSHELRTPMNAILGMTEFLDKTKLDANQKDKVGTIKKNGESLLSIIMDILSISELGTGELTLEKKKLNLEECIEGAARLATKEKKDKPIELKTWIDPEIPDTLIGDPIRVKQLLMHLLSNAFKFTERGEVLVSAELVNTVEEQVEVHFKIIDNGIGISEEVKAALFSAFSQAQSGNTRRYGGAGLGLTIVKQLVEMMEGSLQVSSKEGEGTTVSFSIILTKLAEEEEQKTKYRKEEIDKSLKILYAEDNPVNQKLIAMMLKTMGLELDIAENGKIAWEMAQKKQYHIIFMDIQMPEMDGFEATERIVADVSNRPVIIAVTANATESDKKKCFESGMNDFLTKPIKANDLKEALLKWQNLREYLDNDGSSGPKYIKLSS